jgi:hypothetical protein
MEFSHISLCYTTFAEFLLSIETQLMLGESCENVKSSKVQNSSSSYVILFAQHPPMFPLTATTPSIFFQSLVNILVNVSSPPAMTLFVSYQFR